MTVTMMTDQELHAYEWANVKRLDQEKVKAAVAMLQEKLGPDALGDIRERITEDRTGWLGGRRGIPCTLCNATGTYRHLKRGSVPDISDADWYAKVEEARQHEENLEPPVECPQCHGTTISDEWPLHHGWGTAVRNLLRKEGFGEKPLGIENLDDVYGPLVELAAGFDAP